MMPSTSKKQHNFMAAVANNPSFAKKAGVPQSVGKEFNDADKGKTFKRGGDMASSMGKPVMKKGMSTAKDGMKRPTPMADTSMGGMGGMGGMGMKKGGMPMKMKDGKKVPIFAAKGGGIEAKGKTKGKMISMNKGGRAC
jgi:FtsP/CotA-like multicopper oxidase with cupredoxin domain